MAFATVLLQKGNHFLVNETVWQGGGGKQQEGQVEHGAYPMEGERDQMFNNKPLGTCFPATDDGASSLL
jgi:hypothetical protein